MRHPHPTARTRARRTAALALAASSFVLALLSACGGGDDTPGATPLPRAYSQVTTLAGSWSGGNTHGNGDSLATPASFNMPLFLASNALGTLFVADTSNNQIRQVLANGQVSTLATGSLNQPRGVARHADGTLYVVMYGDHSIVRIDTLGRQSVVAGATTPGDVDDTGSAARFRQPEGITVAADGTLYVADTYNHKIRKITPAGDVTTLAGSSTVGSNDGIGTAATFDGPTGITLDASGSTLYVADSGTHQIRQITLATGMVTTIAGSGVQGSLDDVGTAASFFHPQGVTLDPSGGTLYVADYGNHKIRRIVLATRAVSSVAGSGRAGSANGTGMAASFNHPFGLATGPAGEVYVADSDNHLIRQVTPEGVATTHAGSGAVGAADNGASFIDPRQVAVDLQGNAYVLDVRQGLSRDSYLTALRKITVEGIVSTLADISATNAAGDPQALAVDAWGNLYVTDAEHHRVHRISPTGSVSPFAGSGAAGSQDGAGLSSTFESPNALATDPSGSILYVADRGNKNIRKIVLASGVVSTLAGPGIANYRDGAPEVASLSSYLADLAADASGTLYVAGLSSGSVSKITPSGMVSLLAGSGADDSVDGKGVLASFSRIRGIAVDRSGTLYVAENTGCIRQITPAGDVSTLAGQFSTGFGGEVDGPLAEARFVPLQSIAIDAQGRLLVAELRAVRRVQ